MLCIFSVFRLHFLFFFSCTNSHASHQLRQNLNLYIYMMEMFSSKFDFQTHTDTDNTYEVNILLWSIESEPCIKWHLHNRPLEFPHKPCVVFWLGKKTADYFGCCVANNILFFVSLKRDRGSEWNSFFHIMSFKFFKLRVNKPSICCCLIKAKREI